MKELTGKKWIAVHFDHTLCRDDMSPIKPMVDRVKKWISAGFQVRIVTARVSPVDPALPGDQVVLIERWCLEHIGQYLRIQYWKGPGMIEIWDDKNVAVERDTGRRLSASKVDGSSSCNCHEKCLLCDLGYSDATCSCTKPCPWDGGE